MGLGCPPPNSHREQSQVFFVCFCCFELDFCCGISRGNWLWRKLDDVHTYGPARWLLLLKCSLGPFGNGQRSEPSSLVARQFARLPPWGPFALETSHASDTPPGLGSNRSPLEAFEPHRHHVWGIQLWPPRQLGAPVTPTLPPPRPSVLSPHFATIFQATLPRSGARLGEPPRRPGTASHAETGPHIAPPLPIGRASSPIASPLRTSRALRPRQLPAWALAEIRARPGAPGSRSPLGTPLGTGRPARRLTHPDSGRAGGAPSPEPRRGGNLP